MPASSDRLGGELLAAVNAGRKRSGGTERTDAIAAVDLFIDAQKHRAQHAVRDHLVEALIGQIADRSAAGTRTGRRGCRRRSRRWCGTWTRAWRRADGVHIAALRRRGKPLHLKQYKRG